MKTITEKVKCVIIDVIGFDEKETLLNTDTLSELGCDSLDIVNIGLGIEEKFGIGISDDDFDKIFNFKSTVEDIIQYIHRRI